MHAATACAIHHLIVILADDAHGSGFSVHHEQATPAKGDVGIVLFRDNRTNNHVVGASAEVVRLTPLAAVFLAKSLGRQVAKRLGLVVTARDATQHGVTLAVGAEVNLCCRINGHGFADSERGCLVEGGSGNFTGAIAADIDSFQHLSMQIRH